MNKLLIVLLAVCLVSVQVHGFVKRDAPAAGAGSEIQNNIDKIQKQLAEFGEEMKKTFDPEAIKTAIAKTTDDIKKQIDEWTKKEAPKP